MCVYVFIKCGNYSLMIIFFPRILREFDKKPTRSLTSRSTRYFFFHVEDYFVPLLNFFFVLFKERKRIRNAKLTRGCLSKRVKNISRRSNTQCIARVYSFKTTIARQDGGVWSSFFFRSTETNYMLLQRVAEKLSPMMEEPSSTLFPLPLSNHQHDQLHREELKVLFELADDHGFVDWLQPSSHAATSKRSGQKKFASTPCTSSFRTEEEEETRKKQKKKQKETKSDERKEREERKEKESSTTSMRTTTNTSTATHSTRVCGVLSPRTRRVCDCFGCEAICEKVRSVAAGGLHVCEMHKRKDAFLLKGRGEDMKFRWCFYCHRPQKIEEFSPSSRSICTEKFALRKQRRKVKSELANKNKHIKEATAPTSFVFDDCSTVDPMSFVMDECLNYDDDCLK